MALGSMTKLNNSIYDERFLKMLHVTFIHLPLQFPQVITIDYK